MFDVLEDNHVNLRNNVIRYPSLSSAMIQIVDQSSTAFDRASRNMRAIKAQAGVIFGRTGHVNVILMHLQDPKIAKTKLLGSMAKFQAEMEKCAAYAREIDAGFVTVIESASEVKAGMGNESTIAAQEQDRLREEQRNVGRDQKIESNALRHLESRVATETKEYAEAKKRFDKVADKGELSAMALGAVEDIKSTALGAVKATIGLVTSAPKLAVDSILAFRGVRGNPTGEPRGDQGSRPADEGKMNIDPALLAAETMEAQVAALDEMLRGGIQQKLEEGGDEFVFRLKQLQSLKQNVGDFPSKHAIRARQFLSGTIAIIEAILETQRSDSIPGEFPTDRAPQVVSNKKVTFWQTALQTHLAEATKLRAYAASQPGYGFGSTMDIAMKKPSGSDTGYTKVLKGRYEKCMIMRSAAKDAQDNLVKALNAQLAAQAKIIELNEAMKNIEHKNATIEETKAILLKSIDAMGAMQREVRGLAEFFSILANIVSITCMGHAKRYIETIEDGFDGDKDAFKIAYSRAQVETIRETVITLRAHMGFVVKSTDLYEEVASAHINPCMRMTALLPVSATPEKQDEAKAMLELATRESSEAIQLIARREMESYHNDLESRCEVIEEELKSMPQLEGLVRMERAIREGVKESSEEMVEEAERMEQLFEEIVDDDF